jgi:hypothetical protein
MWVGQGYDVGRDLSRAVARATTSHNTDLGTTIYILEQRRLNYHLLYSFQTKNTHHKSLLQVYHFYQLQNYNPHTATCLPTCSALATPTCSSSPHHRPERTSLRALSTTVKFCSRARTANRTYLQIMSPQCMRLRRIQNREVCVSVGRDHVSRHTEAGCVQDQARDEEVSRIRTRR